MKRKKLLIVITVMTILAAVLIITFIIKKNAPPKQVERFYNYEVSDIERVEMNRNLDVRNYITMEESCYDEVVEFFGACKFVSDYSGEVKADDWKYKFLITANGSVEEFVFYDGYCQINGDKYIIENSSEADIYDVWMAGVESMDSWSVIMSYVNMLEKDYDYDQVVAIMGRPGKTEGSGIMSGYYYIDKYQIEIIFAGADIGVYVMDLDTGEEIKVL